MTIRAKLYALYISRYYGKMYTDMHNKAFVYNNIIIQ